MITDRNNNTTIKFHISRRGGEKKKENIGGTILSVQMAEINRLPRINPIRRSRDLPSRFSSSSSLSTGHSPVILFEF